MNLGPDHLSRIESGEEPTSLEDNIPNVQLFVITMFDDQYQYIIQFLSTGYAPAEFTTTQKKHLVVHAADFQLTIGHLYKMAPDDILRRCLLEHKKMMILNEACVGVAGVHYTRKSMVCNILQVGLWCPTMHADDA